MGYYDFNDHFWSSQEVCGKLEVEDAKKSFWSTQVIKLVKQFFLVQKPNQ